MRIGKISVLFCMLAPVAGLTASRLAPAGETDFYGVGPACLGLGIFAGLTLIGGLASPQKRKKSRRQTSKQPLRRIYPLSAAGRHSGCERQCA